MLAPEEKSLITKTVVEASSKAKTMTDAKTTTKATTKTEAKTKTKTKSQAKTNAEAKANTNGGGTVTRVQQKKEKAVIGQTQGTERLHTLRHMPGSLTLTLTLTPNPYP
jgi:hypothetical protein